ncbi:MAG: S8 family serine peptidase [Mycobacteriales bacterium]
MVTKPGIPTPDVALSPRRGPVRNPAGPRLAEEPRPVPTSSAARLSRRLTAVALPAAALLVAGLVAALPSAAAGAYTATGSADAPAPVGFGVTDTAFTTSCPVEPATQGTDGWVFILPTSVAVAGTQVAITGDDGAPTDVNAYVYDSSCGYLRSETSQGALSFALKAGDRYLSVYTQLGIGTDFTLTATASGGGVDPSPTATATATSTPTAAPGLRGRYTYPANPNDPLYAEAAPTLGAVSLATGGQWGMAKIHAPQAWQQPQATGAGIQVGVLDTGLDLGHPDFACQGKVRIAPGATPAGGDPQDLDGHGTHVAGIIGACTNNGIGVVGVAPDATVVPFRVLGPDGGTAADLATAIRAATDAGVHVINMSLGFGVAPGGAVTIPGSGSALGVAGVFPEIDSAIAYAEAAGVVVVAAAGNESTPLCGYPALSNGVVCVGSTDRRDAPAWYGNFPVKADGDVPTSGTALVAPGGSGQVFCDVHSENILSTYARNLDTCDEGFAGYRGLDGTSMATPHVVGVAALVYDRLGGVRSAANAAKVITAMKAGAVDLGTPGYDTVFGSGRIDALGAVNAVAAVLPTATPTPTSTATSSATASPTPTVKDTALALTARASVQRTDPFTIGGVLTSDGAPLAGRTLQLAITGQTTSDAVTDAEGRVSWTFPMALEPGSYEVTAGYAGTSTEKASGAHQPLDVLAEDTGATLALVGAKSKDGLTARVFDADAASSGVAGVLVTFWADGVQDGSATTDANGRATYLPTKKSEKAKTYELRFAGDSRWRGVRETLVV